MLGSALNSIFGRHAEEYIGTTTAVLEKASEWEYYFVADDIWERMAPSLSLAERNKIVVGELLQRAHLAAVASLFRAQRWFQGTANEYAAGNLLAWSANLRGLLEAAGDSIHSLGPFSRHLADNLELIRQLLRGRDDGHIDAAPLEDLLIHFTHARKLKRTEREDLPETHNALLAIEYIMELEGAGLPGAKTLYEELCQIAHPSQRSVDFIYEARPGGTFVAALDNDRACMDGRTDAYKSVLEALPSVSFNPGLLILRVLQKVSDFPRLPALKKFDFQNAPAWKAIQRQLR